MGKKSKAKPTIIRQRLVGRTAKLRGLWTEIHLLIIDRSFDPELPKVDEIRAYIIEQLQAVIANPDHDPDYGEEEDSAADSDSDPDTD